MDDIQDKVRRNLVTFSALIVCVAFLGVDVAKEFRLFGMDASRVSLFRLWTAVSVVLLYLFLRYHFDGVTSKERRLAYERYREARHSNLGAVIAQHVKRHLISTDTSCFVTSVTPDPDFHAPQVEFEPEHAVFEVNGVAGAALAWNGVAETTVFRIDRPGGNKLFSTRLIAEYSLPLRMRFSIQLKALLHVAAKTGSIVDMIVPHALFLLAGAVCIFQLVMSSPHFFDY